MRVLATHSFRQFPFTSPPVHHRVPPGSERALTQLKSAKLLILQQYHLCVEHFVSGGAECSIYYMRTETYGSSHIRVILAMPANRKSTKNHNTYQSLCVQSIPPDDWQQICPKHVKFDWRNKLRIKGSSSWFSLHECKSPAPLELTRTLRRRPAI